MTGKRKPDLYCSQSALVECRFQKFPLDTVRNNLLQSFYQLYAISISMAYRKQRQMSYRVKQTKETLATTPIRFYGVVHRQREVPDFLISRKKLYSYNFNAYETSVGRGNSLNEDFRNSYSLESVSKREDMIQYSERLTKYKSDYKTGMRKVSGKQPIPRPCKRWERIT